MAPRVVGSQSAASVATPRSGRSGTPRRLPASSAPAAVTTSVR